MFKILIFIVAVLCLLVVVRVTGFSIRHRHSKKALVVHAQPKPPKVEVPQVEVPPLQRECLEIGTASWYGATLKGHLTASGEKYDPKALTAASRVYPLGTELNVINLKNDRSVLVTINDRGPYVHHRIIDLSVEAAQKLGMKKVGLAPVCIQETSK